MAPDTRGETLTDEDGTRMSRDSRTLEIGSERWRALEAWRGRGGVGLLYFVPLEDGEVRGDGSSDRRASLGPEERLAELGEDELRARCESGTALTGTERRFRSPEGDLWLAQSVGPVWAEGGVAEGITAVLFTALEGEPRRVETAGGHVGRMSSAELVSRWRAARRGPEGPETSGRGS